MVHTSKRLLSRKTLDIAADSRREIIGAKNLVALVKQKAAKMGSKKVRAAGDQDTSLSTIVHVPTPLRLPYKALPGPLPPGARV